MSIAIKTTNPFVATTMTERVPLQDTFPEAATQSFSAGDLVYLVSGKVTVCPADPALIAGRALEDATGVTDTAILIEKFMATDLIDIQVSDGSNAALSNTTYKGTAYEIVKLSNTWYVDQGAEVNTRVVVHEQLRDRDDTASYSYWARVSFLSTYLQFAQ